MTIALELLSCSKTYSDGQVALNGVDLVVPEGSFFGLLGPNGAGKTTLIQIVSALTRPTHGEVKLFGQTSNMSTWQLRHSIGLVPQEFNFNMHMPIDQILINHAGYFGIAVKQARPAAEQWLKRLDLWDKRTIVARNLSGGMKRRLMIARALMHRPKLLLLDEPTTGIDVELRRSTWNFLTDLNQTGVTILLTTHNLEEAENLCGELAIINRGQIVNSGSVVDLLQSLAHERFMIRLEGEVPEAMELHGVVVRVVDAVTIEVICGRDQALHDIFEQLSAKDMRVQRVWKRSSRLEELFIGMIDQDRLDG